MTGPPGMEKLSTGAPSDHANSLQAPPQPVKAKVVSSSTFWLYTTLFMMEVMSPTPRRQASTGVRSLEAAGCHVIAAPQTPASAEEVAILVQ